MAQEGGDGDGGLAKRIARGPTGGNDGAPAQAPAGRAEHTHTTRRRAVPSVIEVFGAVGLNIVPRCGLENGVWGHDARSWCLCGMGETGGLGAIAHVTRAAGGVAQHKTHVSGRASAR